MRYLHSLKPLCRYSGKLLGKLHLKISTLTDRRVRLTGEILNGIRAIKMYTWENPLSDMIGNLRKYVNIPSLLLELFLNCSYLYYLLLTTHFCWFYMFSDHLKIVESVCAHSTELLNSK